MNEDIHNAIKSTLNEFRSDARQNETLDVSGAIAALARLKEEGLIPHATFAGGGYGAAEHLIALRMPERFTEERRREIEALIRNALPDNAKSLPIYIDFDI